MIERALHRGAVKRDSVDLELPGAFTGKVIAAKRFARFVVRVLW